VEFRYVRRVLLGYCRVSSTSQSLDRQIDAVVQAGVPAERIYTDKKSGVTVDRAGLKELLGYARSGDVIIVHTLDRLGRTVRDTLNLIHDLTSRGVGVRNLADPIRVDSTDPTDPMAQLAVVLLALFAQMERTTPPNAPRTPALSRWRRAAVSGGRCRSPRSSSPTPGCCGTPAPAWPRSAPTPASPAPPCTGTYRPGLRRLTSPPPHVSASTPITRPPVRFSLCINFSHATLLL